MCQSIYQMYAELLSIGPNSEILIKILNCMHKKCIWKIYLPHFGNSIQWQMPGQYVISAAYLGYKSGLLSWIRKDFCHLSIQKFQYEKIMIVDQCNSGLIFHHWSKQHWNYEIGGKSACWANTII